MGQKLKDGVHVIRSWKADHACPDKAPGSTNLASAYEALQLIWGKVDLGELKASIGMSNQEGVGAA
jgi:hypothetical protein